ncbi:MAG TPA: hypothetical protein VLF93_06125 [Candidatus Saccharimonadales bacterium]|nr:hypothetical protein [Candidatus Saccharimonadales bacterium]
MQKAEVLQRRYELLHDNPGSPVRHVVFAPNLKEHEGKATKQVKRDVFGNRLYVSDTKSYFDREGNPTRAAFLISPAGEAFMSRHYGILSDAERGAFELTYTTDPRFRSRIIQEINLRDGRRMSKLSDEAYEGQSNVYLLEAASEEGLNKYVVRKKANVASYNTDFSQPYINEMLQAQQCERDLGDLFSRLNVRMPTYLVASGQFSISQFEEGTHPSVEELRPVVERLFPAVDEYIGTRREPLWNNIYPDAFEYIGDRVIPKVANFIKKSDTLVWIDPFIYWEEES